tara:strand:- start:1636 stop:3645 length:2010 start_codon:yes stop_codon:yes gene_type:complete
MATQLQIRRGTSSQVAAFTGAEGEIVVNTTNDSVHVNDGSTAGGFELARADLNNVSDTSLNAALTGNTVSALTITTLTLGSTAITATGAEINILDGVTATAAELNILDGVTSTAAELNILDGVTATTAELNYVDGVTSAIQAQIDAKAPLAQPQFTDRVGIGVAAHSSDALNITSTNQHIRLNNGSELGILALTSDGDLDFWAHGADEKINFRTGTGSGTVAMNVVGTKVGIGGTPATARLEVTGAFGYASGANSLATSVSKAAARINGSSDASTSLFFGSLTNDAEQYIQSSNGAGSAADDLVLNPYGGSVGIGTSSPSKQLHQIRTGSASDLPTLATETGFITQSTNVAASSQNISIIAGASGESRLFFGDTADEDVGHIIYNHASNYMLFSTAATEAMRISAGKVAMGTSSADAEASVLSIKGTDPAQIYDGQIIIHGSATSGAANTGAGIGFKGHHGTGNRNLGAIQCLKENGTSGNADAYMRFVTRNNSGGLAEAMRIDASQNLIVGGTSSGAASAVTLRADGVIIAPQVYSTAVSASLRDLQIDSSGFLGYSTSTRDTKENIESLTDVSWLLDLAPVSFNRKITETEVSSEIEYGLVAEDVESVNPDICFYDETEDGQELAGITYSKLITPILKLIQEQQATIESQATAITDLTTRLTALENN